MKQLCNVSYYAQAEEKTEPGQFEKWLAGLNAPPRDAMVRGRLPQTFIDPVLDSIMPDVAPREVPA